MAWMLITFAVPHIGKWFGPKPYKKNRTAWKYSFWYNLKYWGRTKPDPNYLSYHEVWKRSFNDFQPTLTASRHLRGNALVRAHNPQRYFITKAGVEGGCIFSVKWYSLDFGDTSSRCSRFIFTVSPHLRLCFNWQFCGYWFDNGCINPVCHSSFPA